jgi:hypothetical protein
MSERKRDNLRIVDLPVGRRILAAPPILIASTHTVDYCCRHCGTVLLHAEVNTIW